LALLSIIKHGKTWYQRQGFTLNDKGLRAIKRYMRVNLRDAMILVHDVLKTSRKYKSDANELIKSYGSYAKNTQICYLIISLKKLSLKIYCILIFYSI